MRRRPPRRIHLEPAEVDYLESLTRDGRTEQRVARRARILLAMADPDTIVSMAAARWLTSVPRGEASQVEPLGPTRDQGPAGPWLADAPGA